MKQIFFKKTNSKEDTFFKPTPLYKEFLILSLIADNENITQREIAKESNSSVAMVNLYLEEYEKRELIKRKYHSSKEVRYKITRQGEEKRKLSNIMYLEAALAVYNNAKKECEKFLLKFTELGIKNVLFYGAGEVAEIMLNVVNNSDLPLNVLGIIDDNPVKQGKHLLNKKIMSLNELNEYNYDGILISCYIHSKTIYEKLINSNIKKEKILQFF